MELRNSICKAIDGVALLCVVLKIIIAWALGLETIDYPSPEAFR